MTKCYAVVSGRGGVGKSTVTACLGAVMAQNGHRTVIVDADIGLRSQDALLGLENRVVYDLIDVVSGACPLELALLECESVPGLQLLPAAQFSRAKALDARHLNKLLLSLRNLTDVILVDCPAGIERGLRNVLGAGVDEFLLLALPDDLSLRSAERVIQVMEGKNLPRPSLIVNRIDSELIRNGEMMSAQTAAQLLDLPLIGEIPEDRVIQRVLLKHALPVQYQCEAQGAFRRIASRLDGKIVPLPAYGSEKQPLFKRFFSRPLREVMPLDHH